MKAINTKIAAIVVVVTVWVAACDEGFRWTSQDGVSCAGEDEKGTALIFDVSCDSHASAVCDSRFYVDAASDGPYSIEEYWPCWSVMWMSNDTDQAGLCSGCCGPSYAFLYRYTDCSPLPCQAGDGSERLSDFDCRAGLIFF